MKEVVSLGVAVCKISQTVMALFLLFLWLLGFLVAQGTLSTVACIFPFYAYYVVMEKVITHYSALSWLLN